MTKKEKKITMGLIAALSMSSSVATANLAEMAVPLASDNLQTIVKADNIELKYNQLQLSAAVKVAYGQFSNMTATEIDAGQLLLNDIEALRLESSSDVHFETNGMSSKLLIENLLNSSHPSFVPDERMAAVIFIM